jgi:hypothetical protein
VDNLSAFHDSRPLDQHCGNKKGLAIYLLLEYYLMFFGKKAVKWKNNGWNISSSSDFNSLVCLEQMDTSKTWCPHLSRPFL